jgi:hypothetical protein
VHFRFFFVSVIAVSNFFCIIFIFRFIPPEDFNLALLTLELEFVKKGTRNEQVCRLETVIL